MGILSSRWQQGADDERQRKERGQEGGGGKSDRRSDATLFSPLHDVFIYF